MGFTRKLFHSIMVTPKLIFPASQIYLNLTFYKAIELLNKMGEHSFILTRNQNTVYTIKMKLKKFT